MNSNNFIKNIDITATFKNGKSTKEIAFFHIGDEGYLTITVRCKNDQVSRTIRGISLGNIPDGFELKDSTEQMKLQKIDKNVYVTNIRLVTTDVTGKRRYQPRIIFEIEAEGSASKEITVNGPSIFYEISSKPDSPVISTTKYLLKGVLFSIIMTLISRAILYFAAILLPEDFFLNPLLDTLLSFPVIDIIVLSTTGLLYYMHYTHYYR